MKNALRSFGIPYSDDEMFIPDVIIPGSQITTVAVESTLTAFQSIYADPRIRA